ncbi:MAG: HD domain-containing protein [Candidatus Aminicenantes bacterium]|jgi:putative nucleotidyltransferase with HDIG domain
MKVSKKVLILDKNAKRRDFLSHFLTGLDIQSEEVKSLSDAINQINNTHVYGMALISPTALDNNVYYALSSIKSLDPHMSVVLLANLGDTDSVLTLLHKGTVDYVASPDNIASVFSAIKSEFHKQDLTKKSETRLKKYRALKVEQKKYLKRAADLEEIYDNTLENLMTAMDLRDVETYGHSKTVARYTQLLSHIMGIQGPARLDNIRKGSLLHDVGKIAIPDSILKKIKPLTAKEWEKIKLHPALGYGLIKEIKMVDEVGNIILYHHERYDGKGYPKGLKKDKIPMEARIFALADALDAITSHRPYRKERSFKTAKKEIQNNSGSQFDPQVVEAFSSVELDSWEKIRYETTKLLPHMEQFVV